MYLKYIFKFQTAIALFDMLDFYESAICLNISSNNDIGTRGWQACARTLKKVNSNYYLKSNEF